MKDAATGKKSKANQGTDWDRLQNMSDAAVHAAVEADPDAHPTDEEFWRDAKVVMPQHKEVVTIRLDPVCDKPRRSGRGRIARTV